MDAVLEIKGAQSSLVRDIVATPPEPAKAIENFVLGLAPSYIVAERCTGSQANVAENYKSVFAKFGNLNIRTGMRMTNQHCPRYLGMAFLFTLPCDGVTIGKNILEERLG